MLLYLIRHAWAESRNESLWPDDAERPLSAEGRERFERMAGLLVQREFCPELIATSPLLRCRQTAEILVKCLPRRPKVIELKELAPGSDLEGAVAWTEQEARKREQIAWVGHAPDIGIMAAELLGDARAAVHFSKGAAATIAFDGPPKIGRGELRWLVTAKVLGV